MPQPRKYASHRERQAAYRNRQAATIRQEQKDRGLPALPAIASLPGHVRWNAILKRCLALLTTAQDEMSGYFDERSETWQEGDRGEAFAERIDSLSDICSDLEELCDA